jgi:hypothetical protein
MYYPLSQIKTNLYTNGGEYAILLSGQDYTGYYFKTSTGKYYTGKTPQDLPNDELVSITVLPTLSLFSETPSKIPLNVDIEEVKNIPYIDLSNTNLNQISYLPYYNPQLPTQQDYQNGVFRRFFCKKTNEIIYVEIDKTQYDNLVIKNSQILWQLYEPFNVSWQLTGDKQQTAQVNRNIVELTSFRLKLPNFNLYLKEDYTKYYQ